MMQVGIYFASRFSVVDQSWLPVVSNRGVTILDKIQYKNSIFYVLCLCVKVLGLIFTIFCVTVIIYILLGQQGTRL